MKTLKAHGYILWQAVRRFLAVHGPEHAGNMAFLGMLAIFPFLIFLLSLAGFLGQTGAGREAIAVLIENLPPEVAGAIIGPIETIVANTRGDLLTGSILFALWTSITGVEAARKAVIEAYGSWEYARALWLRHLQNLGLVVLAALIVIVAMSLVVLLPAILRAVQAVTYLPPAIIETASLARWIISPLAIFLALLGLYRIFAPKIPAQRRYYVPGALLAVIIWMVVAHGLSVYLAFANRYDAFYGSLAGVVITLLFLFIVSLGFILGAHLNAAYSRARGIMDSDGPAASSGTADSREAQAS